MFYYIQIAQTKNNNKILDFRKQIKTYLFLIELIAGILERHGNRMFFS